ncbi:4-formylbenzenesulfonate dehydrogenase TsaC1/TsaC2-like [Ciona intestinalis]
MFLMDEMKSKVVLITGASSGIGEGIAYAFARKGAYLSLCGRNAANLAKVAEKCVSEGATKALEIVADLTNLGDMERLVDETVAKLGQIDVLINNAGYCCAGGVEDATVADFDMVFSVNLRAPYYLIQRCIPHLKKTQGCVINTSSTYSLICRPDTTHYSLTKVGLDHLTRCAALDLGKYGIRVNNVNPGLVITPIQETFVPRDQLAAFCEEFRSRTPLRGEMMTTQEIADVVIFLASSGAKWITGTCIPVDQGRFLMGH